MVRKGIPQSFIDETYKRGKERHPNNCYGLWTWLEGSLKVKCQGCGYTMLIDPATKELKHPKSAQEAVENTLAIREYGQGGREFV